MIEKTQPPSGTLPRLATYNTVGLIGLVLQQGLLVAFVEELGLDYLVATAGAVQATILHNFVWHERWTWRDRATDGGQRGWRRLVRFVALNGTIAIVGQVAFTGLYVAALDLHYAVANLLAIATCSVVSFLANDRLVFRTWPPPDAHGERSVSRHRVGLATVAAVAMVAAVGPSVTAAELRPETVAAWTVYVEATEQRIQEELESPDGFLVQDFEGDGPVVRGRLVEGGIHVEEMASRGPDGGEIAIPNGAIHHWRGGIFIAGVSLDDVLSGVQTPLEPKDLQEDVLESRVLERRPDGVRVFLKLRRQKFVTVHYNTEHVMRYVRYGTGRASSRSVATRIAELRDAGTPQEREHPVGHDRGFLWRLNSYWRYEEVPGGVIVECESLSLSRDVPAVVRWMVAPMIRSAARESMERTLTSMQRRLRGAAPDAGPGGGVADAG